MLIQIVFLIDNDGSLPVVLINIDVEILRIPQNTISLVPIPIE